MGALLGRPRKSARSTSFLNHKIFEGDVCDEVFMQSMIRNIRPAQVFHLAGITHASSGYTPLEMFNTSIQGTLSLLTALQGEGPEATTVIISSCAVYGAAQEDPIHEDCSLAPINPYGASKVAQELLALGLGTKYSLRTTRARTFNLVGPGEPSGLVCSALAQQIAKAELGSTDPVIQVGKLDAKRDFLDVRDAAAAYLLLGEKGLSGEAYNVCSGASVEIGQILDLLVGMAKVKLRVIPRKTSDHASSEVNSQRGSFEKLQSATGWKPEIPLEQSLRELLDDWRKRLVVGASAG